MSWAQLCLPKVSGGWNIPQLELWNKSATIKLLWNLARKADSLWSEASVALIDSEAELQITLIDAGSTKSRRCGGSKTSR